MDEYISKTLLLETINTDIAIPHNERCAQLLEAILNAPVEDVVRVVKCKDCDIPHNKWTGCPNLNGLIPPPDFYCAFGKPKHKKEMDNGDL